MICSYSNLSHLLFKGKNCVLYINVMEQQENSALLFRNQLGFPSHVTAEVSFKQP